MPIVYLTVCDKVSDSTCVYAVYAIWMSREMKLKLSYLRCSLLNTYLIDFSSNMIHHYSV